MKLMLRCYLEKSNRFFENKIKFWNETRFFRCFSLQREVWTNRKSIELLPSMPCRYQFCLFWIELKIHAANSLNGNALVSCNHISILPVDFNGKCNWLKNYFPSPLRSHEVPRNLRHYWQLFLVSHAIEMHVRIEWISSAIRFIHKS